MAQRINKSQEHSKEFAKLDSTLDEHCCILLVLFDFDRTKHPETTHGFNELYRRLYRDRKKGFIRRGFSRQTLSLHLKHLLEKGLIEVRENSESNLKIKPRMYKSSKYWNDLSNLLSPIRIPKYEKIVKEFRNYETKPLTALLLGVSAQICIEVFDRSLTYPEFFSRIQRDYIYEFIENMVEVYRSIVLERQEKEEASRAIKMFDDFFLQKIREKYGSVIKEKILDWRK